MKIIVFDADPWEKDSFRDLQDEHDLQVVEESLTEQNAGDFSDADVISAFIYSSLDREVLEHFDHLKLIATRSTGIDHIDQEYCEQNDIRVANVLSYGANTVAEHAIALLLAVSRRLVEAVDRTRRGDFSPRGLQGFDLCGKTLGIVGTGDIGRNTARIARGFDMRVLAFDVAEDRDAAREIGFEYVPMDRLLAESDVLSLHVPGNEKTRHMIAAEEFNKMKEGAVLINTARGSVVDIRAMVRAIADGKLRGAGLDVLPEEPVIREEAELLRSIYEHEHDLEALLADHVLTHLRNVVVTPHCAFNTREGVQRILDTTVDNIRAFCEGRKEEMATP